MFGPNQVGELIVGNAVATETTVATFVSGASDKEIKVLSKDGTVVTAGKPFHVLQSTSGSAAKGLNFEFSDKIWWTNHATQLLQTAVSNSLYLLTFPIFLFLT